MKVKVAYTVDLENITDLVKEIIIKNQGILTELKTIGDSMLVGDLGVEACKSLGLMEEKVSYLLDSYADCESILVGYLKTTVPTLGTSHGDLFQSEEEARQKLESLKGGHNDDVEAAAVGQKNDSQ